MITVKVCYEDSGRSAKGLRVGLGFSGGLTSGEWTDSRGEAHFQAEPGSGVVYVDGDVRYRGYLKGRVVVYV